jgi:hypothetical protein
LSHLPDRHSGGRRSGAVSLNTALSLDVLKYYCFAATRNASVATASTKSLS